MNKYHVCQGHLFQHYDSRGGTIGVIGLENVFEAARLVLRESFLLSEVDLTMEEVSGYVGSEWAGRFILLSPIPIVETDLEETGQVLLYGIDLMPSVLGDGTGTDPATTLSILQYVPTGAEPIHGDQWWHPDWNDDAFGFLMFVADKEVK